MNPDRLHALSHPPPFLPGVRDRRRQDRAGRRCSADVARRASAWLAAPPDRSNPLAPRAPHFAPKAKRVIHLFMAGAPSQLDLFDHKPELTRLEGKPLPPSVIGGQRYAFIRPDAAVLGPRFEFARHGQCGAELSEMLPHLADVVDDICIIKSVQTDQFNHAPAQIFFNTGFSQPGRPSLGSWVLYGLGSRDAGAARVRRDVHRQRHQRRLGQLVERVPADRLYRACRFRNQGDPILNVSSPPGVDAKLQRDSLDLIGSLNRRRLDVVGDPEIATRIAAYEMAFRLQTSAPELMDLKSESKETLEMYGCRSRQAVVRAGLPAGAADDRARSAVREHLSRRLGRALRRVGQSEDKLRRDRPGDRRPGHRPQAARSARRHAGDLGRRIRPHAHGREQRRPRPQPGPRPSSAGVHHVDGRRRHQARH